MYLQKNKTRDIKPGNLGGHKIESPVSSQPGSLPFRAVQTKLLKWGSLLGKQLFFFQLWKDEVFEYIH
jgi:hypothetical protein